MVDILSLNAGIVSERIGLSQCGRSRRLRVLGGVEISAISVSSDLVIVSKFQ